MMRHVAIIAAVVGLLLVAPPVGAEPATISATGPDTTDAGETVTISYTLTNTGENDSAYILDVSIPDGWNVESHTDDGGTWQEGESDWLWQTIAPGESVSPSVTLTTPENADGGDATIRAVVKSADGVEARTNHTVTVTSSDDGGGGSGGGGGSAPIATTPTTTAPATTTSTDGGQTTPPTETSTITPTATPAPPTDEERITTPPDETRTRDTPTAGETTQTTSPPTEPGGFNLTLVIALAAVLGAVVLALRFRLN